MMTARSAVATACAAALFAGLAAPALAAPFDDAFFARKDASAAMLLTERKACASEASRVDLDQVAGFTDPRYGMLAAMAARLDSGAVAQDAEKAVRRAYLDRCMTLRGWTIVDVSDAEAKRLRRLKAADLDAWLKANEPQPPAPAPAPAPATSN